MMPACRFRKFSPTRRLSDEPIQQETHLIRKPRRSRPALLHRGRLFRRQLSAIYFMSEADRSVPLGQLPAVSRPMRPTDEDYACSERGKDC